MCVSDRQSGENKLFHQPQCYQHLTHSQQILVGIFGAPIDLMVEDLGEGLVPVVEPLNLEKENMNRHLRIIAQIVESTIYNLCVKTRKLLGT